VTSAPPVPFSGPCRITLVGVRSHAGWSQVPRGLGGQIPSAWSIYGPSSSVIDDAVIPADPTGSVA
jgi:hypothetical protein